MEMLLMGLAGRSRIGVPYLVYSFSITKNGDGPGTIRKQYAIRAHLSAPKGHANLRAAT